MTLRPGKEFKVQIGKSVPDFILYSKKKTQHEDEATKHEGSKREKGEQTTEEKETKEKDIPVEKPSGEEGQATTSPEKEPTTTTSTSPTPTTTKPGDSHGEKIFEVNEVFQGKTKQHYTFLFFFRENAEFEDREEMWSIRDMWDDLQKVGNGLTVYGFSTGSKMDKIQLMRRKLKLPFEIFPDNNYEALRNFMPVGGTTKWIGALAPVFGAKINCAVLVLGDKTVARVYPDHWSAEKLLHDMRDVDQRITEGRPLVDEPSKEESHPATGEKEDQNNNNNNANVATAIEGTTEKPAKSEKKKKEKEKDKKRDKDHAAVSEGAQGEEKPSTSTEEEGAKEGAKEVPKKKERTKSIWNTLRKRTSPRSDSNATPISDETVPPTTTATTTTTTPPAESSGVTVTDSNVNTTNSTTTTGIAPSEGVTTSESTTTNDSQ